LDYVGEVLLDAVVGVGVAVLTDLVLVAAGVAAVEAV